MARGIPLPSSAEPTQTASARAPTYWPTHGWRESAPERQGIRSDVLADALLRLHDSNVAIHSLLIVRHGYVVLDAAFYPYRAGDRHDVASVTKSITSILTGMAIARGYYRLDSDVDSVFGQRTGSAVGNAHLRVENLLAMQSGFDCGFGHSERELEAMKLSSNWTGFVLDMPRRSAPGSEFGYCSPNYHLLSALLTRASGHSEAAFARQELFAPLGIDDVYWPADPDGLSHGWGDLQLRPRDLAKIGLMLLHRGIYDGQTIVPPEWFGRVCTPRVRYGDANLYGLGWWTHPTSPRGFCEAIGRGGQRLSIWPEKDLVVVITGGGFEPGVVGEALQKAMVADSSLPPNPIGLRRLESAITAVGTSPEPVNRTQAPNGIVGERELEFAANSLGLRRARFIFADTIASVTLNLADRTLQLTAGLDGRYRIAGTAVDNVVPAARAEWRTANELIFELNLVGKIDHYVLDMKFGASEVMVGLHEKTGLMHETLQARLLPNGSR